MSCIGGRSQPCESDDETTLKEGGRHKPFKGVKKNTKSLQGRRTNQKSRNPSRRRWPKLRLKRRQNNDKSRSKEPSNLMDDVVQMSSQLSLTEQKYIGLVIPFLKMSEGKLGPTSNQTIESSRCKLIDGYPCEESHSDIRIRKSYVMSYNKVTKNADWVYEILNEDTLKKNFKNTMSFGKNKFKGNKYDQGHLAAAANHRWCQEAYHDTYLISNMVPQVKRLNKGDWKRIENYCRNTAKNAEVRNVHVYTGPLYLKKKRKKENPRDTQPQEEKAVPTHLFKVIIVENKNGKVEEPECYVIPELEDDYADPESILDKYSEKIERIQKLSGLIFIKSNPEVVMDRIETITWTGEGETGEICSAVIKVRISLEKDTSDGQAAEAAAAVS